MTKSKYAKNDTRILYVHVPNVRTSKVYVAKTEFKRAINKCIIMSWDLNTPLSSI